jgi:glucosamine--fructose-6-phosphate aminotransferase (isomerizing)
MADSIGLQMAAEIAEQPAVIERLKLDGLTEIARVAAAVRQRKPRFVLLAGRGTSDHAAMYAKYLIEITLQIPCGLVSPSVFTVFGARQPLDDVLLIAVSQSGGSPDLAGTIVAARESGATTLAFLNNVESPVADAAEFVVDVRAGAELAVAATKSFTAELLALWMFVDQYREGSAEALSTLAEAVDHFASQRELLAPLAQHYRFADRIVVTGRGFAYPVAREGALKLMETSYIAAHAFSGADFLHGPVAMIDSTHPVLVVAPEGAGATALAPVLEVLRGRSADLAIIGSGPLLELAPLTLSLPRVTGDALANEELGALVAAVPLQWLAWHMAVSRGHDPDGPRGLNKVTQTV